MAFTEKDRIYHEVINNNISSNQFNQQFFNNHSLKGGVKKYKTKQIFFIFPRKPFHTISNKAGKFLNLTFQDVCTLKNQDC